MKIIQVLSCVIVIYFSPAVYAQTTGGHSVFNFLTLPLSPGITASGGVNVSDMPIDAGMAITNPAAIRPEMHGLTSISFTKFLAGINIFSASAIIHPHDANTTLGFSVLFADYGSIPQTDASGNISGSFHPADYSIQLSASWKYLKNWNYGGSFKIIHSSYGMYRSSAIAFDAGILYEDSLNGFNAGVLAKNMGFQLKTYVGQGEDLPFDLEAGFSKKFKDAPFGFSLTAAHIQTFAFKDQNPGVTASGIHQLINHFILGMNIYTGPFIEARLGYNFLRRYELNTGSGGNGFNGFSGGIAVKLEKLRFVYSVAAYENNTLLHHAGISIPLNKTRGFEF